MSGYIEVQLKALTPVHISGHLEGKSSSNNHQSMYQEDGQYCIPAASIRGCLRAFTEALTAGWVSQVRSEYKKEYKKRHVGFSVFDTYQNIHRSIQKERISQPAINPNFKPKVAPDGIDLATFLFGTVFESNETQGNQHHEQAYKSRIWIEDALIVDSNINQDYWIPSIAGEAFMGGPKPSASNWWYLKPKEIWLRKQRLEFIGESFWGRKFYYHQDPKKCMNFYRRDQHIIPREIDCLSENKETKLFRIYLNKMPKLLIHLFLMILVPGQHIRHKLGYAKAFGYGSVEFSVKSINLRYNSQESNIPEVLRNMSIEDWLLNSWDSIKDISNQIVDLIDWNSLNHLSLILGMKDYNKILYTYPSYNNDFKKSIPLDDFNNKISNITIPTKITPQYPDNQNIIYDPGYIITKNLSVYKKAIHFRLYQETSNGWDLIKQRKP